MVLAAAVLVPAAALQAPAQGVDDSGYTGGPVDITLYGHIYDLLQAVPMNTHPMHADAPDLARGYSQPTIAPSYGAAFNRLHLFNSMGPVEYNTSLKQPRIHPEKGLALPIQLDKSKDVTVYWYMSADALELQQIGLEPPVHVGAVPQLHVRAEVRLGNDVRKDLGAGNLVAAGEAVVDLVTLPGADAPMEVVVSLGKPLLDEIPQRESFNLGVEWFQADQDGRQVLMPGWNIHTGAQYPNRLVIPIVNPLYIYFVEPQFQQDKLAVNAALNTPFGNYDVDKDSLQIEITGPNGFRAKTLSEPVLIQHSFQHNEHHVATLNGWLWDYKADRAPPGEYKATVRGSNLQASATVEKSATFTIEDEGEGVALDSEGQQVITEQQLQEQKDQPKKRSPGFEPLLLLALAALALLARRRQAS